MTEGRNTQTPESRSRSRGTAPGGARLPGLRRRELASLNAIAEVLNRSTDLPEALTRTLALVAEVLGLHSGWVWLLDDEAEFFLAASYRLPPYLREPSRMTGWRCLCLRTFETGDLRGAANVNVLECSRLQDVVDGTDGLHYHASIPIYLGPQRIGVMNVAMPQWRELAAEELQFLYTIGYQAGLAVERTRLLAAQVRLAQVEERNRLAREIHDTVAQKLAGLALRLEAADAFMSHEPERARSAVQEAIDLTHTALDDVRRSVMDLRAAPLEGLPLGEALRRLLDTFARESGVHARLQSNGPDPALPPRLEEGIFRIVQESLTNVARHARAHSVVVRLSIDGPAGQIPPQVLHVSVEDDGRGLAPGYGNDPAGRAAGGHFGLLGMRERARLLGGTLSIASEIGKGTRIELVLPLEGLDGRE